MRIFFLTASFIIMGSAFVTSCSKSGSSSTTSVSPTVTTNPYFMKATVNGAVFSSTTVSTIIYPSVLRNIDGFASATSGFPAMNLGTASTATGTFPIDGFDATAQIDSSTSVQPTAVYGSITISAINDTAVSGSFYFTCSDSTRVTNGSFYAKRAN